MYKERAMKVTLRRSRNPVVTSIVKTYSDFAENSSIHGLKYTVQKDTSTFEKILWIVIVTLGVTCSIFMVGLFWERFTSNPTRTSVDTTYAPTTDIPFPAITICNINKILASKLDVFIKKLDLDDTSRDHIRQIFPQLMAYTVKTDYNISDLNFLHTLIELNESMNLETMARKVSQTCNDMLVKCKWEAQIIDCKKHFIDTFTPNGACCSFNYKPKNSEKKLNRTFFFGFQMGLTILLNPMPQNIQYSPLYSNGMKVIIHHPLNYPGFGNTEKILAVGRETLLQLEGTRYICSDEIRVLTPKQRKCVYSDEHPLRYFREYSEPNCVTECLAGYLEQVCGCSPYFYTFSDKPVCNITRIPCIASTRGKRSSMLCGFYLGFVMLVFAFLVFADFRNGSVFKIPDCDCPMQCEDTFYDVLSTSTTFTKTEYHTSSFLSDVNTTESSMLLHVYFSRQTQTILLRDTLTSTIYLLSSFGGIFSLFLGCSFISAVEIIYFACVRFPINLQMLKEHPNEVVPSKKITTKTKKFTRFNHVTHGNYYDDNVYTIYGKNVFIN